MTALPRFSSITEAKGHLAFIVNLVKGKVFVAQPCPTLFDPMDCSLPGSVLEILQIRILAWIAIPYCYTFTVVLKIVQK